MTTIEYSSYLKIQKLVIANLKSEAKNIINRPVNNWTGDGYLTDIQLKKATERRKKLKRGHKMLLEAFKLLKY